MAADRPNLGRCTVSNKGQVEDRRENADAAAEDARLVTEVVEGRSEAFDVLVRRYDRRALAVAYRLLGNVEDAADVAQDAMLRGYRSLHQLADRERFGPWLMRIVRNLSLNYRRSRALSPAVGLDDLVETGDSWRSVRGTALVDAGGGSGEAEAGELRSVVDEAMRALPEKQRMSLVLFSIEGMSQKEVARVLDCTVDLVKWNVFQARKQLKLAIELAMPTDGTNAQ